MVLILCKFKSVRLRYQSEKNGCAVQIIILQYIFNPLVYYKNFAIAETRLLKCSFLPLVNIIQVEYGLIYFSFV